MSTDTTARSATGPTPTPGAPTEVFDHVVVGAGSAGAALANRLTADGTTTVLLLEAGGRDRGAAIHIPAAFSQLFKSRFDWDYETVPQDALGGRTVYWPRGKVLGGSSSLNAMMWVRGFAADYDEWARAAGPGWSWESLLPYFKRVERVMDSTDPDHGTGGAVHVQPARSPRAHTATFLEAVRTAGHTVEAANTRTPAGFSQTVLTQQRGARASTAVAYLAPAAKRRNLVVRTDAHATRVVVEGGRAVGVDHVVDGQLRRAGVRGEVVLCGGAVNTPQLLQLSGIGDAALLRSLGVEVVVDAPEVGENLRDHLFAPLAVEAAGGTLLTATKALQLVSYLTRRRGMLTSNVAEAYGFLRSEPGLELPDLEVLFAPVGFIGEGLVAATGHALTLGPILLRPRSAGRIAITTADPFAKPRIDPRYLTDPAGADRAALLAGLAWCEALLASGPLAGATTGRFLQPAGTEDLPRHERDALALVRHAHTLYHPTGTARMGSDPASVVDEELRVRGVQGLRVADASIMPEIIRGHTNAPSIVIGEKAADLVAAGGRPRAVTVAGAALPAGG